MFSARLFLASTLTKRPEPQCVVVIRLYSITRLHAPFLVSIRKDLENAAYSAYSAYSLDNQILSLPIYASQLGTSSPFCLFCP